MRRIYGAVLALVSMLLVAVLTAGPAPAAGLPALGAPAGASGAGSAVAGYTRKLPPPADSIAPAMPAPGYQPLTCLSPVINTSQTSGNEDESFAVVNPTN